MEDDLKVLGIFHIKETNTKIDNCFITFEFEDNESYNFKLIIKNTNNITKFYKDFQITNQCNFRNFKNQILIWKEENKFYCFEFSSNEIENKFNFLEKLNKLIISNSFKKSLNTLNNISIKYINNSNEDYTLDEFIEAIIKEEEFKFKLQNEKNIRFSQKGNLFHYNKEKKQNELILENVYFNITEIDDNSYFFINEDNGYFHLYFKLEFTRFKFYKEEDNIPEKDYSFSFSLLKFHEGKLKPYKLYLFIMENKTVDILKAFIDKFSNIIEKFQNPNFNYFSGKGKFYKQNEKNELIFENAIFNLSKIEQILYFFISENNGNIYLYSKINDSFQFSEQYIRFLYQEPEGKNKYHLFEFEDKEKCKELRQILQKNNKEIKSLNTLIIKEEEFKFKLQNEKNIRFSQKGKLFHYNKEKKQNELILENVYFNITEIDDNSYFFINEDNGYFHLYFKLEFTRFKFYKEEDNIPEKDYSFSFSLLKFHEGKLKPYKLYLFIMENKTVDILKAFIDKFSNIIEKFQNPNFNYFSGKGKFYKQNEKNELIFENAIFNLSKIEQILYFFISENNGNIYLYSKINDSFQFSEQYIRFLYQEPEGKNKYHLFEFEDKEKCKELKQILQNNNKEISIEKEEEKEKEEEEEEEEEIKKENNFNINTQLLNDGIINKNESIRNKFAIQGFKNDIIFLGKNNNTLEVFGNPNLNSISFEKEKNYRIRKIKKINLFHSETQISLLERNSIFLYDIEKSKIIKEFNHPKNEIYDFCNENKYSQMTDDNILYCINGKEIIRFDARSKEKEVMKCKDNKNLLKYISTTNDGEIIVGSSEGNIKFYDKLRYSNVKNKTPIEKPIKSIDVTKDGNYVLLTCDDCLIVFNTQCQGTNCFKSKIDWRKKNKLIYLKISEKDKYLYSLETQSFNNARFNVSGNEEESLIVTSIGNYIVVWDFNSIKKGIYDKYHIKKDYQEVIDNCFKYNSNEIIVTMPNILRIQNNNFCEFP